MKQIRQAWRDWIVRTARKFDPDPLAEPRTLGMLIDCGGDKFVVDPRDAFVGRTLRDRGVYEPGEQAQIAARLSPNDDVLFVGAHIGALAIPASRLCRRIAMIEANPDTYRLLAANCALNAADTADLHNFAAGEADGHIRFVKNTVNSGGSKREPRVAETMYYDDDPETVDVPMRVLDDVFADRRFDLAVMDIEGSEYFALCGMQRILRDLPALIIEFVPHHLSNVSGVTVAEFLRPILPHFQRMTAPSQGQTVEGPDIEGLLEKMYEKGHTDGGLIFERT